MRRYRGPRERPTTEAVLLVALGAIGGLLIGAAVADRLGGLDGLRHRLGSKRSRRHRADGWRGDERRSQPFDQIEDDDSELAPESIAHMHLHGRHPLPPHAVAGEELERRVLEAFRNDPMLAHRLIDISADDTDGVTLTGWVRDPAEQRYAAVLARGVPGVRAVHSELAVAKE
jgi:hypothetical protein